MLEERGNKGGTGDPQWTTSGVGEEPDESAAEAGEPIAGPGEAQGGTRKKSARPRAKPRGKSAAGKAATGTKRKNAGQLKNPRERKARKMGPPARAKAGTTKKPKGRAGTAAGRRTSTSKGAKGPKGSRGARRR